MVSIPDWSKFRRLGETAPSSQILSGSSKYYKQQAYEIIKQAEKHGYFVSPTQNLIQKCVQKQNQMQGKDQRADEKDLCLANVLTLRLPHMRLRGVGDISLCYSLRVCILNNNYIKRFDALVSCSQLIRLDLHSNQITSLPNSSFWSYMDQLQVLNLHDNPIGGIENLHYLANCSNLVALTMYDTPLSLKSNYRHHVVNSIWSLKSLDHHIISDEEIIEDANFSGRFSALDPSFKVNLCPEAESDEDEIPTVHNILRTINKLMAHVSPVLIIQRYSRGYLLRKHYKALVNICRMADKLQVYFCRAAVTIQRKYREWKGLPSPVSQTLPPPSPVAQSEAIVKIPIEPGSFDYDTYLKNRRPGSGQLSDPYSARHSQIPSTPAENMVREEQVGNLFIDFSKLQTGDEFSGDQDVDVPVNTVRSGEIPTHAVYQQDRPQRQKDEKKRKKKSHEPKRHKTVKHFFGPIVESTRNPTPDEECVGSSDQPVPLIRFRLRGRKENVVYYDATTEMLLARREAGQDVRIAEDNFHRQQMVKARPTSKPRQQQQQQSSQRSFARVQGTMGLTCLQAIQQAYRDREKAERSAYKKEIVLNMKDEREAAKERLRLYQEEKRQKVMQQREQEQRQVLDQVARLEKARMASVQRYGELRKLSSRYQKQCRDERTFIVDFSVQNTSVSNALLRHDWQARAEDQFSQKINLVQGQKDLEQEQQEVVKKYMEHRQLMRQTESAMSRAAVDTKMLQEANERLVMARNRVTQLKSRNENVSTFYPLPCVSSQPLPKIPTDDKTGSLSMKHFNKWNSDKLFRYNTAAAI